VGCNDLYNEDGCLLTTADRNLPRAIGVNIKISPNPTSERTTVQITGWKELNTKFSFQLYDTAGRKVFRKAFRGDRFELLRPKVTTGNYFYEVYSSDTFVGSGQITFR
jgi:GTPase SAR1 family protein